MAPYLNVVWFLVALAMIYLNYALTGSNLNNFNTYYDILGVERDASRYEIRSAYKSLILKWHPDKNSGTDFQAFESIQKAYEVLSNSEKRRLYDFYFQEYDDMKVYFENIIFSKKIEELYAFVQNITILFDKNLNKNLVGKEYSWVIAFYDPRCIPCRNKVNYVKNISKTISKSKSEEINKVRIGVLNCHVSRHLCQRFQLDYMGQLVIFSPYQEESDWDYQLYNGPHNEWDVILAAKNFKRTTLNFIGNPHEISKYFTITPKGQINRKKITHVGIVEFYSHNCFHCMSLKQEIKLLSRKYKDVLHFGIVDCSKYKCNVPYLPYLKLVIKREGQQRLEEYTLEYDNSSHPGSLMVNLVGVIFGELLGMESDQNNIEINNEL